MLNQRQKLTPRRITKLAAVILSSTVLSSTAFANTDETAPTPSASLNTAFDELVAASKNLMMSDPRGAMAAATNAEELAASLPAEVRDISEATALWLKAEAALRAGVPQQGAAAVETALTILEGVEDDMTLEADLLLARGRLASRLSQTELAARSFFDAHKMFVELEDSRKEAMALQAIGSIYRDAESYSKALDYYQRANDVYEADAIVALSMANNRGNILLEMQDYDAARSDFMAALAIAEELDSGILTGRILTNLGNLEVGAKNLRLAAQYADRAHRALDIEGGAEWDRFASGVDARIALARSNLEAAKQHIETAFADTGLETTSLSYEEMHRVAQEVYESLGDWENAYVHQRSHKRISDEAKKIASSSNLAIIGARFQFAEQQLNIERLKNEQLQQEQALNDADRRQQIQRIVMASGGVVLLFAFLAAIGAYSNKRRVTKINDELSSTVDQLNEEIERRQIIEKDLIKARDEAEQADRMKSTFLATMSHELRTPMNGILGFTEVLLADDLTQEQREQIGIIDSSGRSLLTLINDILDLSQIEAGKLKLRSSMFNLRYTVMNTIKLLRTKAQEKQLNLVAHYDPNLPSHVTADEDRIRQILINLVGNAIKFTESGTVAVMVTQDENGQIRFEVNDTGMGIPADKKAALFERFSQIEDGSTRRFEGSGLGLAICQELVAAMDGNIDCESEPGKGSSFFFTLPLAADNDAVVIEQREEDMARITLNRVVLLDGDEVNRVALAAMLKAQDIDVVSLGGEDEAIDGLSRMAAQGDVIDAIFASDRIDDGDARGFAENLRRNKLTGNAPFVFYGGVGEKAGPIGTTGDYQISHPIFDEAIVSALRFLVDGVDVPQEPMNTAAPGQTSGDVIDLAAFQTRQRVLVVDDVAANRMLVEAVLGKMGIDTLSAENGKEALEMAKGEAFGAILMDVYMPVMGGVDAVKRIRAEDGPNQSAKIFALTASSTKEEKQQALDAGMDEIISKPLDLGELKAHVLKALGQSKPVVETETAEIKTFALRPAE